MSAFLTKTYKVSEKTLRHLQKKGVSENALSSLASLQEQLFDSQDRLLERLKNLPQGQELLPHEALILKQAAGYFRLDEIIPNKTTREWTEALIFALIVATIVRTFLFAPFKIPSSSMVPTIHVGDHIFATMYSYGIPIPFTEKKLFSQPIQRGDIVIFPFPANPSLDYIKRVVGLPGETVKVVNDQVFIDDQPLEQPYAYFDPEMKARVETLIDHGTIMERQVRNFGPVKVPEGHIFVMGDNRYNSQDSRFWGFVEAKTVKGKAQRIYWSKTPTDFGLGMFAPGNYHFDRLLKAVE